MTEIILVRHGETEWNVGEVFRGRTDIELSETGIRQAEFMAEFLSDVNIDAIYSSPLKRAIQTAETIARYHHLEVEITHGLIDFNYGQWQGLSLREVESKYPEAYSEWTSHPEQVIISGGENLSDVRKRVTGLIDEVIAKYKGTVVMVAHRVVNKVLICALLGLDNSHFWNIRQDTCGITTFIHEKGSFILTSHNDTSFLKSIHKAPLNDF